MWSRAIFKNLGLIGFNVQHNVQHRYTSKAQVPSRTEPIGIPTTWCDYASVYLAPAYLEETRRGRRASNVP